ncbi:YHYH protein [Zobellia barbeyronii]|uniref:YHYH protein n=1 Tax=Zobellia barbeyronii TaxID=2748009 RepID=A0ABS5WDT8_9FLAO|nr:YHYH protein [Zobellia barbeyronii]MBT2161567.1 YHYH protein [Zobellia barbeyronii]
MKNTFYLTLGCFAFLFSLNSCSNDSDDTSVDDSVDEEVSTELVMNVDPEYFTTDNLTITTVPCTLSDGTETDCYKIVTGSTPSDHEMGPWCPDNITDNAEAGGIWLESGEVYDVDGAFIQNMANFYNDEKWQMYDENGDVFITATEDDCINAANPDVGAEYENFCVECIPSYITDLSQTWLIPVTPVLQSEKAYFSTGGGGPMTASTIPSTRGVALNGIEYSAPAPTNSILSAYTLAPFDDAGGHINVHQGYHYHAATGYSTTIDQDDDHAPLIGYAMDGNGIYEMLDDSGNESTDLDDCRGHSDDIRGYHYHIDAAGNNNFINCLKGAYVIE